jgi:hypothetical protein
MFKNGDAGWRTLPTHSALASCRMGGGFRKVDLYGTKWVIVNLWKSLLSLYLAVFLFCFSVLPGIVSDFHASASYTIEHVSFNPVRCGVIALSRPSFIFSSGVRLTSAVLTSFKISERKLGAVRTAFRTIPRRFWFCRCAPNRNNFHRKHRYEHDNHNRRWWRRHWMNRDEVGGFQNLLSAKAELTKIWLSQVTKSLTSRKRR